MVLHLNSLRIGLNSKLYWIVFIKSDRWSINQFFHRYEGLSIAKVPLFYLHSRPSFSLFFVSDLCFLVNFSQFIELPFVCFSIWLSIGSAIDSRHLFQKRDYKVFLSISFHCLHEEFGGLLIFYSYSETISEILTKSEVWLSSSRHEGFLIRLIFEVDLLFFNSEIYSSSSSSFFSWNNSSLRT